MKIQWSVLFALFLFVLAGCGSEQFGSVPQSTNSSANPVTNVEQLSCAASTLIKPKVDILYIVDNSPSSFYIPSEIRQAISNTVTKVSSQFDYRIIGTTLLPDSTPYDDYQVLTNSEDTLPNPGKRVISASELNFFATPSQQNIPERGLARTYDFARNSGVVRASAYLVVVLLSNGRDSEVETDPQGNGNTVQTSLFTTRYDALNTLKTSPYQLHFYSATAKSNYCGRTPSSSDWGTYQGWWKSTLSYVAMADSLPNGKSYDICNQSITNIFDNVNNTIKQEVIPHQYRFFPMTFAKATDTRNTFGEIKVYRVSGNSAPQEMTSGWTYHESTRGFEYTRELPTEDERVDGRHFIRFNSLVSYPDCIQIKSATRTEYFKYIVLNKAADKTKPISVRINGNVVSSSNWVYKEYLGMTNIKADYPNPGDDQPPVTKSGYMIEITNPASYYKSGDSVEVSFTGAAI